VLINSNYFIALLLAIVIEITVALFFGYKRTIELLVIILVNIMTSPLLNYFLSLNNYINLVQMNLPMLVFLEIVVVLFEWLLLLFVFQKKPLSLLIMSFIMNLFSYLGGLIIFR